MPWPPIPLDAPRREFLQAVYRRYQQGAGWPMLALVEKTTVNASNMVDTLGGYVRLDGSGVRREQSVVLTARGMWELDARHQDIPPLLAAFAVLAGYLAAQQDQHVPVTGQLDAVVTSDMIAALLQARRPIPRFAEEARLLTEELRPILRGEGWLWSSIAGADGGGSGWSVTLGPGAVNFIGVRTAAEYMQRLDDLLSASVSQNAEAEAEAGPGPSDPGDTGVAENGKPYDVALSFAGEQREYVEAVAGELTTLNVRHFYDRDHEERLWGKPSTVEFPRIYRDLARYVVVFISEHYASKAWPTREFRASMERDVQQLGGYILPVRFDETELPGLDGSITYLRAERYTPRQLAEAIARRVDEEA